MTKHETRGLGSSYKLFFFFIVEPCVRRGNFFFYIFNFAFYSFKLYFTFSSDSHCWEGERSFVRLNFQFRPCMNFYFYSRSTNTGEKLRWVLAFQNSKEGFYPSYVCCLTVFTFLLRQCLWFFFSLLFLCILGLNHMGAMIL